MAQKHKLCLYLMIYCLTFPAWALFSEGGPSESRPRNQAFLGEATYEETELYQLARPTLLWADNRFLLERVLNRGQALARWGYAGQVEGEINQRYTKTKIRGYVSRYGGFDLGVSLGDGRAVILDEDLQSKGARQTMMVSPDSVQGHRNGAALMGEGILESIWGGLLNYEFPYGAYRNVALIATGSLVTNDGRNYDPRVLIIREDPIRAAHMLINPTAEQRGMKRDAEHVAWIMDHLLDVLPKPPGQLPESETHRFLLQSTEMIDRQAVQAGYAWAHNYFHGAIDAANVGLDGRLLDYGTFSAFDGYPRARIIPADGFSGETETFREVMLKEIYDSWLRTLPEKFRQVLPPKKVWDERFVQVFERTRREEMLKLAGSFPELNSELSRTAEGQRFSELLMQIAQAGNEEPIEVWKAIPPYGRGTYRLPAIFKAAAECTDGCDLDQVLRPLIPDTSVRSKFVTAYLRFFNRQREFLGGLGIAEKAERAYRKLAVRTRNKTVDGIFRSERDLQELRSGEIRAVVDSYKRTGDAAAVQAFIDRKISASRREFRDADPFTVVVQETFKNGVRERVIFSAKNGLFSTVTVKSAGSLCEPSLLSH